MSLSGKKARDTSQLPTLSYEIKLNLPGSVDSKPQEISFLDLIANDTRFKSDKESLELVLSSYVKACGKQSVKEILAERDTLVEDKASLSDIIHALMDYNDQQNADLGVGYNDPEDDDSFIDDSTAAQDNIPRNMTNERDGFYVNEKRQPIQARYLSDQSDSESGSEGEESGDDDDDDDESSDSEKEDKKINDKPDDGTEKPAKKSRTDDDITSKQPSTKRKRSVSEAIAPTLPVNLEDKTKATKPVDEPVKKVQKINEIRPEANTSNAIAYVLPNEMDHEIRASIEKLVKLILGDQSADSTQKKMERLFNPSTCRELLDLVKKLHRHTNAHRQLVFDILGSKTSIYAPLLVTHGRLLLLNDYEPQRTSSSLGELKAKLRVEINRSLEFHVQAHDQAIKEWQQKMAENPSKDKNRGPRKNFRLHKTINELIIRCIDRQLETMTLLDADSLELFLHDQIVSLWDKSGWMTAKKIISEVIRLEYRPLRDANPSPNPPVQVIRAPPIPAAAERIKKDSSAVPLLPPPAAKISSSILSPTKPPQQQTIRTNEIKSSSHSSSNHSSSKALEMATRVSANPPKQHTPRPSSTESTTSQLSESSSHKLNKSEGNRPIAKPTLVSQTETATKRSSAPNFSSVIDLTMDLFTQYQKQPDHVLQPAPKPPSHLSSNRDSPSSSSSQRSSSSTSHSKQLQQQQQQQFAAKLPSEKAPAGSFLKEALMTGASSPKMSASPLAVDNMLSKPHSSPKPSTTLPSPIPNPPRSSSSHKSSSHRPTTDFVSHRTDQPIQQQKTPSSSSRSQPNVGSPSSSVSPASRRPTSGFPGTHESQSNRGHSSQMSIPPSLSQSLQWDSATLQLAAAALANPQLLNSAVFDPTLFNTVFGSTSSLVPSSQSSSARQQHSQQTSNNRRP